MKKKFLKISALSFLILMASMLIMPSYGSDKIWGCDDLKQKIPPCHGEASCGTKGAVTYTECTWVTCPSGYHLYCLVGAE